MLAARNWSRATLITGALRHPTGPRYRESVTILERAHSPFFLKSERYCARPISVSHWSASVNSPLFPVPAASISSFPRERTMERAKNTPESTVDHRAIARGVHLQRGNGTSRTWAIGRSAHWVAISRRGRSAQRRPRRSHEPLDPVIDERQLGPGAACYVGRRVTRRGRLEVR